MSATYFQQIFELSIFGIQKYSDYLRKQRCNRKVRLKKKKRHKLIFITLQPYKPCSIALGTGLSPYTPAQLTGLTHF